MSLRLAPGAFAFGGPPLLLGAALFFLPLPAWVGVLCIAVGLGVFAFHRDPDRAPGPGIVSPSDGRVAEAATGPGGGFFATFLNVHNVHVVRAPDDARVTEVRRIAGPKAPAWSSKARHNAGVEVRLETAHGEARVRMLVGFIARRVVPYVHEGQTVAKGERIGLIRFGSRVELVLPRAARVTAAPGQKVRAGVTQIAEVPP